MSVRNKPEFRAFLPMLLIFALVSALSVVFRGFLENLNIDQTVLITGNLVLFIVGAASFVLYHRALLAGNTQVFLRNVYSGMLLKFFVSLTAAFIYLFSAGPAVNKPGLFGVMFLYLLYTFAEMAILMKQSKQIKLNKNA
ncbi:MAG: hypothetical protein WKF97_08140 [Chitinophagaceae bacterium]